MKYTIRYNQTRGQPGRGSKDHAWRVFDETGKEYLFKNIKINVSSFGETDGKNWNICCYGNLEIEKNTSTAIING
jgi:hypothetical protein